MRRKRRRLVALRIRRLRADFVAELRVELESECSTLLKRCINSLDRILAYYDGEAEL